MPSGQAGDELGLQAEAERHRKVQAIVGICDTYCDHGGVCTLPPEHQGLHDTGFCIFSDAEAITRQAADSLAGTDPRKLAALQLVRMTEELL